MPAIHLPFALVLLVTTSAAQDAIWTGQGGLWANPVAWANSMPAVATKVVVCSATVSVTTRQYTHAGNLHVCDSTTKARLIIGEDLCVGPECPIPPPPSPPPPLPSTPPGVFARGDPHLHLPHGGEADFRGEDKALYVFLTAKDLQLNVMTELADFELSAEPGTDPKRVHGSFLTQAHIIVRTEHGKMVCISYWADVIGPTNRGFANGTINNEPAFRLGAHKERTIDNVVVSLDYSSLHVLTPEFKIVVTPINLRDERGGEYGHVKYGGIGRASSGEHNVTGLHHRLDVQVKLRVPEDKLTLPPHGLIGQGWDGDGMAINGEKDAYSFHNGEFTTYAMAKGAIEGVPNDYKVATKYATDFKYSRFDATSAAPRNVSKLVAAGMLNAPDDVEATNVTNAGTIGSAEYSFEEMMLLEL